MNPASAVALAYFGKIASRGDFVRSPQQPALTRTLDRWLSHGLELLAVDPRWKQRYDQVGACRFAFVGVDSSVALAGHLIPSVDAAGRRFPFVTAGSFDVPSPLPFVALAPLLMARLWTRLEGFGRQICAAEDAEDAATLLGTLAESRLDIDTRPTPHAAGFEDFLDLQTVGKLEEMLRATHPRIDLRRSLLALGLLLQPLPTSGVSRIDKGLALPLPDDPLYAPLVGAFWMSLVTPFLARGRFELAFYLVRPPGGGALSLCVGFAGGAPAALQAIFDAERRDQAFVDIAAADWVDAPVDDDPAMKKLSSYLLQPQLSARHTLRTFTECFLGTEP